MFTKLTIAIIIIASILLPRSTISYDRVEYVLAEETWTKEKGLILVAQYAKQYNVSEELMIQIITCENRSWSPELQSGHKYTRDNPKLGIKKGEQERSFGLAQIHTPAFPHISIEQAKDAEFSIRFMAENLAKGNAKMWSCYGIIKK